MIDLRLRGSIIAVALATSGPVLAQTAAPAPETEAMGDAGQSGDFADIVVTAQKRSERLNDVGMSITAVGSQELTRLGITTPDDLARITPGFVAAKGAYGTPVYTLRGVGFYDYSLGAVPAVTVYVDQIPLPYSQMAQFAALDVERVEVLKGPQGTLYGLNSTAGAINYIAAKPTSSLAAGLSLTAGSYGQFDARGYVGGPVTDTLGVRAAVSTEQGGGWQKSITRGEKNGDRDRTAARIMFDWKPTDAFSALLSVNYGVDQSDSLALQFQQVTPLNPFNTLLRNARPLLFNAPPAPSNARAADWDPNTDYKQDNENFQTALSLGYELSDSLTVKSLTSYQRFLARSTFDGDGTPYMDFVGTINGHMRAFFQELALYGDSDRFKWILGANYISDRVNQRQLGVYPYSYLSLVTSSSSQSNSDQSSKTKAVFASGDYKLTDLLSLQAGIRYTDMKRKFAGCTIAPDAAAAAIATVRLGFPIAPGDCTTLGFDNRPHIITSQLNEDNVAWRVGLNWKFTPGSLLYANASHGYKSGAYPLLGASRAVQLNPVTQEDVYAYEIGAKIGLGRNVQFNAAMFWYDYNDKQVRGRYIDPLLGPLSALVNVPKSRIKGAEAQLTIRPVQGLTIVGDATYVRSKIRGNYSNFDFLGSFQLLSGEDLPFTPRFTGNANVNYRFPVSDSLDADAGFVVGYRSSSFAGLGELALTRIDRSTTLDLSASIGASNDAWRLRVWGKNVTNEYMWNSVTMVLDAVARNPSPPATYGITLDFKY